MKNILIVTGSDYTDIVYQAFIDVKKMGYVLCLLSDGSFTPREGIFEKHFTYDLRKTKEVLEFMDKQNLNFDAVTIKTSEWLTPLTALLAKQYGCIGNDPLTAFNCRSKYHMRLALQNAKVPIPKFKLCRNFEDVENAIKEIGLPVVAKPVGGNASYGAFMIRDDKAMDFYKKEYENSIEFLKKKSVADDVFAFSEEEMEMIGVKEKVDMVTDYLIEEYMVGPEVSVDALVADSKVTITGIEDQVRMAPPYFLETGARLPYVCSEQRMAEIQDIIEKTVVAMGIKNSPTHTEIIFTDEGPKIVEIGCRIGGDDLHDTIYYVTGLNLMFEGIMIALGIKRKNDVAIKCHTASQFIMPHTQGIFRKMDLPEKYYNDKDVIEVTVSANEGSFVSPPPLSFDPIGIVVVKGKTPEAVQKKMDELISEMKITIDESKD